MFQSLLAAARGFVRLPCGATRPLSVLLTLLMTLYGAFASAAGLGEITVHSALNQPLEAEIALEPGQRPRDGDLSVSLASVDEFRQAGIERLPFLDDLRFTPLQRGERWVIRVVSSKPVNEPFLDFVVQANQANGRQLREYTLLIDPPGSPEIVPAPAPVRDVTEPVAQAASQESAAPARAADVVPPALVQATQASQQLQSQVQELQGKLQLRDEQLARQQQQLEALQRQLSESQHPPAARPTPVPATPAAAPPQAAEPVAEPEGANPWLMVAALLLTALLVLLVMRRRRQAGVQAEATVVAPPASRPTQPLAESVAMSAIEEPLRSAPVVDERRTEREPSIDVDWDLIVPAEPAGAPGAPGAPTVAPAPPFNADSIVWRLEEPDEPGSSVEGEPGVRDQKVWPRLR